MKTKKLYQKMLSMLLAMVMVITVFAVSAPAEVSAATFNFSKPSATSTVTITDKQCVNTANMTWNTHWIKYQAKKNGYLRVQATNASKEYAPNGYVTGYWQLYNKAKSKALSPIKEYNTGDTDSWYRTSYFAVKKGTTYYLRVMAKGGVKLTAKFTSVTDKSGAKKGKALAIKKKNKNTAGLIMPGTKGAHWYKFNLTSNQKYTVSVNPYMTGDLRVTVSGPGVYTKQFTIDADNSYWGRTYKIVTDGKVRAGTYYIKIEPATTTTTGYYNVKWK